MANDSKLEEIAKHLLALIRQAQMDGADREIIGDDYEIAEAVRKGNFKAAEVLAADPDYKDAFAYLLGVQDGMDVKAKAKASPTPKVAAASSAGSVDAAEAELEAEEDDEEDDEEEEEYEEDEDEEDA